MADWLKLKKKRKEKRGTQCPLVSNPRHRGLWGRHNVIPRPPLQPWWPHHCVLLHKKRPNTKNVFTLTWGQMSKRWSLVILNWNHKWKIFLHQSHFHIFRSPLNKMTGVNVIHAPSNRFSAVLPASCHLGRNLYCKRLEKVRWRAYFIWIIGSYYKTNSFSSFPQLTHPLHLLAGWSYFTKEHFKLKRRTSYNPVILKGITLPNKMQITVYEFTVNYIPQKRKYKIFKKYKKI